MTAPTLTIDRTLLTPMLKPLDWAQHSGMGSDDFGQHPAYIALSKQLCAGFGIGRIALTHQGLAMTGTEVRDAWNFAADNLLNRNTSPSGIEIDIRPSWHATHAATKGYQVRIGTTAPTAWLAHPTTFTLLNDHFEAMLSGPVHFHAPSQDLLFVHPDTEEATELDRWVFRNFLQHPNSQLLSRSPVRCENGYPIPRLVRRPTPAERLRPPRVAQPAPATVSSLAARRYQEVPAAAA